MNVLPDLLVPDLDLVFCGTAVATASADRGHYYAGPGNKFWQLLHGAGLTPKCFRPEDDADLPALGIGITDLVKDTAQSHDRGLDFSGATRVASHLISANPQWVAFNGLTAGRVAARMLGQRPKAVGLGVQSWTLGSSRVFVLPSSSGAHATMTFAEKLRWWSELASLARP